MKICPSRYVIEGPEIHKERERERDRERGRKKESESEGSEKRPGTSAFAISSGSSA